MYFNLVLLEAIQYFQYIFFIILNNLSNVIFNLECYLIKILMSIGFFCGIYHSLFTFVIIILFFL